MMHSRLGRLAFLLVCGMVLLAGCVTARDKSAQLSRVAKDWCLTIRASQVMPCYPLTRDLQVGDVFLTTTAIGEEQALFESRGFLPLETHLVRLPVLDEIRKFYAKRIGEGDKFPGSLSDWDDLPGAAFPTYTFDIRRGGGLNLAVPIQGVPVGLSLMGSGAAKGSVTIAEASTVGLDIKTLQPLVNQWWSENQTTLAAYANGTPEAPPVYVRVVTRVYRTKKLTVTLNDASSGGAAAAAGVQLPTPEPGTPDATKPPAERYAELAKKLNATMADTFGANAKFTSVSARSVTFDEELKAPMVIGYIAYDCQVLPGGVLSAPMPTYYRVTGTIIAQPGAFDSAGLLTAWYTKDEQGRVPQIKDWIRSHIGEVPDDFFVRFMSLDEWDSHRWRAMYDLGVLSR